MNVSSRTPEGVPHQCPICGKIASLEPCYPGSDAVCPSCGTLVWDFRHRVSEAFGVALDEVKLDSSFEELGGDSLEDVEFIMEIEEKTGIVIPNDVAAGFRTLRDLIDYVRRRQEEM